MHSLRPLLLGVSGSLGLAALFAAGFLFVFFTAPVLLMAGAGILVAVFFRAIAEWLNYLVRIPKFWGVLLGLILVLGAIIGIGWALSPRVADQYDRLAASLPESMDKLRGSIQQTTIGRVVLDHLSRIQAGVPNLSGLVTQAFNSASVFLQIITGVIMIVIIGVFGALSPGIYLRGTLKLVPPAKRGKAKDLLLEAYTTLKWWLVGRLFSMVLTGLLIGAGLWLVGVPLALTVGILAGVLTFVPNFGAIATGILAVLLGFLVSPLTALYALIVIVVAQILESNVFTPLVQQRAISIPPALLITVQVAFGFLFGTLGLLLASPILAVTALLVNRLYIEEALGDAPAL